MSRAAAQNPDRQRAIRELPIPEHLAHLFEPGARAFRMGGCDIVLAKQKGGWHLSISKPRKLPTWEEVRDARYALIPDDCTMAMLLPKSDQYVNLHEYCLQLYEVDPVWMNTVKDHL